MVIRCCEPRLSSLSAAGEAAPESQCLTCYFCTYVDTNIKLKIT